MDIHKRILKRTYSTHSINRGYTMKYAYFIASLCACISHLMFSMDYTSREYRRPAGSYTHKPQFRNYRDEALERAIHASLQDQIRHDTAIRQRAATSSTGIVQGNISYDDALAIAVAASLEVQHPTLGLAKSPEKEPDTTELRSFKGDEVCPICASTIDELGRDQARLTQCCHQFICKNDAQELEKRAAELYTNMQDAEWRRRYAASPDFTGWPYALEEIERHRHAECPLCRHYPLEIEVPISAEPRHSASTAPAQSTETTSRKTDTPERIPDTIHLFFKFLDTVVTKAVHDRNIEALRLLQQELTPWGSFEQFQALAHTILCIRPEITLHEHDIIKVVWEHVINTIPTIERERLLLEDTMQILSQSEERYQLLTLETLNSLLETWEVYLEGPALRVWTMLSPTQKLFYVYRLKFQCQLADIIEHSA